MRLASYTIENLFERPKAMLTRDLAAGSDALEAHARITNLLSEPVYTQSIRDQIVELLNRLGLSEKDDGGEYARLRQERGRLVTRRRNGRLEVSAAGRDAWLGCVELTRNRVDEDAVRHKAMVMRDVDADVMAVIEADDLPALHRFSTGMLPSVGGRPFHHAMLLGSNDPWGNAGLLTREGYDILGVRSHADDGAPHSRTFTSDCAEYTVKTPSGQALIVLVTHFQTARWGKRKDNDARRSGEAAEVANIYNRLRNDGQQNVAVVGGFNDTLDSPAVQPLVQDTDLCDVSLHPAFESTPFVGTFKAASPSGTFKTGDKLDCILVSPALVAKVTSAGLYREGMWVGRHGSAFSHYPTITSALAVASDHAAIYADFDRL